MNRLLAVVALFVVLVACLAWLWYAEWRERRALEVPLTVHGDPGVTVPKGTLIEDRPDGRVWRTTEERTIQPGTTSVDITARPTMRRRDDDAN